ncbi:sugar phosphate isomerase/epimerase family protein [Dyadobacter aurulentus]|uniref:sugar phosphate isomerase/epimerase family protein n=1 Tax=Dyadobacter sp. UC 10 TaxID=2605428 RepID=UPI0011F384D5|nr:sugar phosphate isomerase/epimerase [Dyadobacter sp. UC 10]KAA0989082.1 sugar phosphate isomerase/epimerase [Dyadobacter sp. UC 10]
MINNKRLAGIALIALTGLIQISFVKNSLPKKALKWETGVALYSFNKFSFDEAIAKADSAGAKFVEGFFFHNLGKDYNGHAIPNLSDEEIARMKSTLDSKGIKMKSLYSGNGKNLHEWNTYFTFSKKMGIEFLTCEPERKDWDLLDSLAGSYQMKIAIHEHARGSSYYWHPDSVMAAMKGRPNIWACADLGHWVRSGLDPVQCLKILEGRIICVHVKDLDEANNLKANDVVAGTGVLNYPAIVKELKRQNFNGMAYIEREGNWNNNMPDVKKALGYLSKLAK